jgi:pimeloyl-ACP methyl ester carboxylesterase
VKLESDIGGEGARLLVLLHGLGATRHVWRPMAALGRWNGRWIAPDLRGHGASAHASNYTPDHHAADVAELVQNAGHWDEIVVLGHSMGGAIALNLASGRFGIQPAHAFGLGIKVSWSDSELSSLRKTASTPARLFESKDEAVARYLKVSGLSGLIAPDSPEVTAGVAQSGNGWRVAYDPASASIGAPPMRALIAATRAPVHLARGETDTMVTHDQLLEYDPQARDLPGGHNAMVENARAVWDWIEGHLA